MSRGLAGGFETGSGVAADGPAGGRAGGGGREETGGRPAGGDEGPGVVGNEGPELAAFGAAADALGDAAAAELSAGAAVVCGVGRPGIVETAGAACAALRSVAGASPASPRKRPGPATSRAPTTPTIAMPAPSAR